MNVETQPAGGPRLDRRVGPPAPEREAAYSELSQRVLARLAGTKTLRPIFRWRWFRHRAGEERPWQYIAPVTEDDVIRLWNSQGSLEIEPLTVELLQEALEAAYEAGVAYEKFGSPADQLYARLGYRRCSRRRVDSIANRKRHNVEFSGVPAEHSSNHPAGGTSAGTQG